MGRQFKVRAKKSFVYKEMGHEVEIEDGKVYDAQDIEVTSGKTRVVHLGIWVKPSMFLDFHNFEQNFEEIS